jgi:hypothetical protein
LVLYVEWFIMRQAGRATEGCRARCGHLRSQRAIPCGIAFDHPVGETNVKIQIQRFSPHQNGKVFAVLMTLSSLFMTTPFVLLGYFLAPEGQAMPLIMIVVFPVMYLVFGYIGVAVGCWFYNLMYPFIGGIEFNSATDA